MRIPVQSPVEVDITNTTSGVNDPVITVTPTAVGTGGRILRITPAPSESGGLDHHGERAPWGRGPRLRLQGFHTSNATDASSFTQSSLSVTFSADGTTMYVADDDAIWQFKTVTSLAGSDSGSLIGLNDLRSLGVPYDGEGSAVAIIDTGVDALSAPFRGRVAPGINVVTGGLGNDDTAIFSNTTTNANAGAGAGAAGGANGTANPGGSTLTGILPSFDGHGTPVAGVVAQFVPQATIVPVDIFDPFLAPATGTTGTGTTGTTGTTGATGAAGTTGVVVSASANALTDSQFLYEGLNYVATHPYVNDPVRPGQVDRIIASTMAFGTTETFQSEVDAFKRYPQVVISLKNELRKFRALGITPIASTGQFSCARSWPAWPPPPPAASARPGGPAPPPVLGDPPVTTAPKTHRSAT